MISENTPVQDSQKLIPQLQKIIKFLLPAKKTFKSLDKNFVWLVILIISLWLTSWQLLHSFVRGQDQRGQFGDQFGAANALFSGLALAGIIYSLFLQKKELKLQRKELRLTREEFKQQNFETTFFNLLKNQQEITKGISAPFDHLTTLTTNKIERLNGLEFFRASKKELYAIGRALKQEKHFYYDFEYYSDAIIENSEEEEEHLKIAKIEYTNNVYKITADIWEKGKTIKKGELDRGILAYEIFFNHYHYALGHYFRHLYHILKFVDESENDETNSTKDESVKKKLQIKYFRYAQFIQSQMSSFELFLLFYNCTKYPKALELVKKYRILENLAVEDLLTPKHNCIEGINLKTRIAR